MQSVIKLITWGYDLVILCRKLDSLGVQDLEHYVLVVHGVNFCEAKICLNGSTGRSVNNRIPIKIGLSKKKTKKKKKNV